MATKQLRERGIWQDLSGENAGIAERNFFNIFTKEFEGTEYRIRSKPREFKDIYSKVTLDQEVMDLIGVVA